MQYDYAVFMGRMQILHNGHMHVIVEALKKANHLIVVIGSINLPRSPKDPFNYTERTNHVYGALDSKDWDRVTIVGVENMLYSDSDWITQVRKKIQHVIDTRNEGKKVCLIGHSKDKSSYYLQLFPAWDNHDVSNYEGLSSTPIRDAYFCPGNRKLISSFISGLSNTVPRNVMEALQLFQKTEDYNWIVKEQEFYDNFKKSWANSPYPPMFVTVDAVVVVGGHILLIRRRAEPGLGLYALPGGYLNQDEYIQEAMIRELREETKIKVPAPVLTGSIISKEVFDHPQRSMRGRIITHAFLIHLKNERSLPKISGSDDADKAVWVPLDVLDGSKLFEDHGSIIRKMVKDV